MRGAGVAPGPVHLIRMSLDDAADVERVEVCGLPRGAVTDPPLYDAARRIAVAYDSANGVVQAFRFGGALEPLWRRELSPRRAHGPLRRDGRARAHDFHGPRVRSARALGARSGAARPPCCAARGCGGCGTRQPRRRRRRRHRDGEERGRAAVPGLMQSVVFPAPGFDRDLYWCTMTTIARVAVA